MNNAEPSPTRPGSTSEPGPMTPPRSRIFLLSHMRAYTSLVGHILGSHPEIDGYYELHRSYLSADDLEAQLAQYAAHDALKPNGRYLFDKLLHNDHALNLALPELADATVLVSLLEPEATLKSTIDLFARKSREDLYATPAGATRYYVDRLAALAELSLGHPGRYRYFDAPLICDDPPRLLAALADWLGLAAPLSESYGTFAMTGVPGAGDSSPAMATGRILRRRPSIPDVALDPALLQQAEAAYRDCRARLIAHAAETVLM